MPQISILLTRSNEQNVALEEEIGQIDGLKGAKILHFPLIEYEASDIKDELLDIYSHFIITSNYGAKLLAQKLKSRADAQTKFALVVGANSAEVLKGRGVSVLSVARDALDLKNHLDHNNYEKYIYLSGDNISVEFPPQIRREIVYKTHYLGKKNASKLKELAPDYVLLYSEACARSFMDATKSAGVFNKFQKTFFIAISKKAAQPLLPRFNCAYPSESLNPNKLMLELLKTRIYEQRSKARR